MSEALPEAAAEGSEHMTVATAHVASMSSGIHATPTVVVLDKTAHAQRSVMSTVRALAIKNLVVQRRSICSTLLLVLIPVMLCTVLWVLQIYVVDQLLLNRAENRCGCLCTQVKDVPEQPCGAAVNYQVLFVELDVAKARARTPVGMETAISGRKLAACAGSRACDHAEPRVTLVVPVNAAFLAAYEKGGALRWDDPAVLRVTVGSVRTACTPVDEADVFQGW